MVSLLHEALVLLFRNRPELSVELLREVFHIAVRAFAELRVGEGDLTEVVPTEYRADLVIVADQEKTRAPSFALVIEVQLQEDPRKRRSWPAYLAGLHARLNCDVMLLVVTVDASVATWAGKPIQTGHPGFVLTPLVLGPERVPIVTDELVAMRSPELAVLSVMAHGGKDIASDIGRAALLATRQLDDERAKLYADLVFSSIQGAARAALEALMASGNYEYQSDFAKRYVAEGKALGVAEGKALGEAHGRAHSILAVLGARAIPVSEEDRARIEACTNLTTLDTWLVRAATAKSVGEILGD